jgi:hypothetical protein
VDAAFTLFRRAAALLKLIVVRSRLAVGRGRAPETDFRHADLASTGPYRMNAAFMRLE